MMTHFGLLFILLGALTGAIFGIKGFMTIREGEASDQISLGRVGHDTHKLDFRVKLVDFILDMHEEPRNKLFVMNMKTGKQESYTLKQGETIMLPQSRWSNLLAMVGMKSKHAPTIAVDEILPNASTVTSITEGPEQTGMAAMEFKITGENTQKQAYVISQLEHPYVFKKAALSIAYLAIANEADIDTRIAQFTGSSKAGNKLEIALSDQSEPKMYPAAVGSKSAVEGTDYTVEVLRYVPDFVISSTREVVSRSDQPNNPALQIRITGPDGYNQEQWLFAKFPTMHMSGGMPFDVKFKMNSHAGAAGRLLLVLNPKEGKPVLALLQDGKLVEKKTVAPGGSIQVPDTPYTFAVERFLHNANIHRKIENRPDLSNQAAAKLTFSGSADPYVLWNENPVDVPGYRMVFEEQPSIKDFYSILQIINDGHVAAEKKIEVNDPLKYGGYTFYQASYDNQNLSWSGLQVKKDPGVGLVYLGFIIMTLGMVVIFYINPLLKRSKHTATERATQSEGKEAIGAAK